MAIIFHPKISRSLVIGFRFPVIFYFGYLITIIFSGQNGRESLISIIRVMEYQIYFGFLIIFLQKYYIYDVTFRQIILFCTYYLILMTTLSLGYFIMMPMADGRLGLPIIHPNTLGILSTIGIITSNYLQRMPMRVTGLIFFTVICLLTLSKGALLGLFLALVIPNFLSTKGQALKIIKSLLYSASLYIIWLIISSEIFLRGQEISYLLEASGRLQVWRSAYIHIFQSYNNIFFGIGFGEGTSIINQHMFNEFSITHWKTHNAHNDILQAWLSGGIIYLFATLYIFWSTYKMTTVNGYERRIRNFHQGLVIITFSFSISMTTVNYYIGPVSSLIWLQFIWLRLDYYQKQCRSPGE